MALGTRCYVKSAATVPNQAASDQMTIPNNKLPKTVTLLSLLSAIRLIGSKLVWLIYQNEYIYYIKRSQKKICFISFLQFVPIGIIIIRTIFVTDFFISLLLGTYNLTHCNNYNANWKK